MTNVKGKNSPKDEAGTQNEPLLASSQRQRRQQRRRRRRGTRFISRNIYSPKIFLRVIVEVFNEILEEKTTNEIKQTDLLVEKSAEIYCSNLFRPKRSSTKINHRNVRWIFHRKKQRIFWPINYSSKVSYITWTLPTRHFIIMEMSLSKKTAQSIKTQVTNNTLYLSLSLSLSLSRRWLSWS